MPARPRLLVLLLGLLLLPALARAQSRPAATLEGIVTDAESGAPLEDVHVFIAVSMIGTVTDADGRFRLDRVPPGAHRIYVSRLGYEPAARDTLLRDPQVYTFDFALQPTVLEIGEVTVEAERNRRWERQLRKFTRQFLGETPNAEETTILNPEVLDFEDRRGEFRAVASAPLVIENRALGYRIQYFLKEFVSYPTRVMYDGEPLFEELTPESPEQAAAWEAARREAFMGSLRHFLLALLAGRTEEQGFLTYSRPASGGALARSGPLGQDALMGNQRFPLDPKDLLKEGDTPVAHVLDFDGFVEIVYTDEVEHEAYLAWRGQPRRARYQTSQIRLERGPAVVDYKGDVLDPYGITQYSYFAFERAADEVPKEYRPR